MVFGMHAFKGERCRLGSVHNCFCPIGRQHFPPIQKPCQDRDRLLLVQGVTCVTSCQGLGGRRCLGGMSEHDTQHKVVVIGGGYAGTLAANHLRMRDGVDITLVNPRPTFVERVRLHQFVAGTGDATVDYGTLLGEGIHLVVDSALRIDTAARTVRLASGRTLQYDYVIYAVGSTGGDTVSVPGAAEFAYPIAELRLRSGCAPGWTNCPSTLRSPWSAVD